MALPTAVNDQITDSVDQANERIFENGPLVLRENLAIAIYQVLDNASEEATTAQQNAATMAQAAVAQGVSILYAIDTATTGVSQKQNLAVESHVDFSVTAEMIEGHIYSRLDSPQGKEDIKRAVQQANAGSGVSNHNAMNAARAAIVQAIQAALDEGMSKQSICYVLHEVAFDMGISMLYPFETDDHPVTEEQIRDYYRTIASAAQ